MLKDSIAAVTLLCVAGAYFHATGAISDSALGDEIGARGLPLVYAGVLAALAASLLIKALLNRRWVRRSTVSTSNPQSSAAADQAAHRGQAHGADRSDSASTGHTLARAAGLLAIGVAYLGLVSYLGYVIALALLLAAVACYQGARGGLRLGSLAAAGAVFFWLLFDRLLGVDMPSGVWAGLLG